MQLTQNDRYDGRGACFPKPPAASPVMLEPREKAPPPRSSYPQPRIWGLPESRKILLPWQLGFLSHRPHHALVWGTWATCPGTRKGPRPRPACFMEPAVELLK